MSEQKPSVGRIVLYQHPGSADGKYPPVVSPAIVQAVNCAACGKPWPHGHTEQQIADWEAAGTEGAARYNLRLWVFGPWGIHINPSCDQGEPGDPSTWHWPPRV